MLRTSSVPYDAEDLTTPYSLLTTHCSLPLPQSVLRTSSVPYDAEDIENRFAHLTNRSIQTTHPDYDDDKQR